jgi:hypothetical protein
MEEMHRWTTEKIQIFLKNRAMNLDHRKWVKNQTWWGVNQFVEHLKIEERKIHKHRELAFLGKISPQKSRPPNRPI